MWLQGRNRTFLSWLHGSARYLRPSRRCLLRAEVPSTLIHQTHRLGNTGASTAGGVYDVGLRRRGKSEQPKGSPPLGEVEGKANERRLRRVAPRRLHRLAL